MGWGGAGEEDNRIVFGGYLNTRPGAGLNKSLYLALNQVGTEITRLKHIQGDVPKVLLT